MRPYRRVVPRGREEELVSDLRKLIGWFYFLRTSIVLARRPPYG